MVDIFKRKFIGLDISDRNIEVVEIDKEGRIVKIENVNRIRLDDGILSHGIIQDKDALKRAVEYLFKHAKPAPIYAYEIYFALPENQSRIHTFFIKKDPKKNQKLKKSELELYIKKEIEENIYFEKSELIFSYRVIKEDEKGVAVIIAASDRGVISQWHNFFKDLKLEIESFDIEPLAVLRGLNPPKKIKKNEDSVFCLVDFGSTTTNITFFKKDVPIYSFPINIAGDMLDKEIAEDLQLDKKDAEIQKIKQGLLNKNSQVFLSLDKVLKNLKFEIKKSIVSFEEEYEHKVKHIIFIGKSSMLKGFLDYMKKDIELEMSFGKPKLLKRYIPIEYIEAIGLALRGMERKWEKIHPSLSLESEYFKESNFAEKNNGKSKKNLIQTLGIFIVFVLSVGVIGSYYFEKNTKEEEELQHKEEELMQKGAEKDISESSQLTEAAENIKGETKSSLSDKVYIKIIETPTGWLNVRTGPGTNFEKITRVDVGGEYLLLEDGKNWYKIKLDDKVEGWVFSEYVSKIKN